MRTFADHLEEVANEPILYAVIGEMGWGDYNSEGVPNYSEQPKNELLKWEDARKWLDYETDYGYGAPKQNAVYCWTENWIVFMWQYDGATGADRIPRNPVACIPTMPGG